MTGREIIEGLERDGLLTILPDDLEPWEVLESGDLAYTAQDEEVEVIDVGEVGHERVAVIVYRSGQWADSYDAKMAVDLLPERKGETMARYAKNPESIGTWPAFRKAAV